MDSADLPVSLNHLAAQKHIYSLSLALFLAHKHTFLFFFLAVFSVGEGFATPIWGPE